MYYHWIKPAFARSLRECRAVRRVVCCWSPASRVTGKNLHSVTTNLLCNCCRFDRFGIGGHVATQTPLRKRGWRKFRGFAKSKLCIPIVLEYLFRVAMHLMSFKPLL